MSRLLTLLLLVAWLTGCHQVEEKHAEENHSTSVADAPVYKEGLGLAISPRTKAAIGLTTMAVSEKEIVPQFTTEVQVYQPAGKTGSAGASGFIVLEHARKLSPGQEARLKSEKHGQETIGQLVRIDTQIKTSTGQVEAMVTIPDVAGAFRNGEVLEAKFSTGETRRGLVVPSSALLQSTGGDFVYVENGDHFLRSPVKLGETFDGGVEILDGLYDGDMVVASGMQPLWLAELHFVKGGKACGGH